MKTGELVGHNIALTYVGTEQIALGGHGKAEFFSEADSMFVFVRDEKAKVMLEMGKQCREGTVFPGEVFFLPARSFCRIRNVTDRTSHIFLIRFRQENEHLFMQYLQNGAPENSLHSPMFRLHRLRIPQIFIWLDDFLRGNDQDLVLYYQLQSHLYAIASAFLLFLQKMNEAKDPLSRYVERIKSYILDHYNTDMDIEKFSRLSGKSSSVFYRAFRLYTGLSPHKYLTTIRLQASLRLLAKGDYTVTEVAHAVGYADELYFSRVFKKHIGLSPSEYAAKAQRRIVIPPIFEGDLAVLGITPVLVLDRGWAECPERYLPAIAESRPDLLLTSPLPEGLYETLSKIASVFPMEWKKISWKERLQKIGSLLGISGAAEYWLSYYETKVENGREHIRRHLGDEPFLLVAYAGRRFRVFGMRQKKMKDLFYEDLQITGPSSVREIRFLDTDSLHRVAELGCDHVLFLVPNSFTDEELGELEEEWRRLRLNRPFIRCLFIRYGQKLLYNAATHERLLDETIRQVLNLANERTGNSI